MAPDMKQPLLTGTLSKGSGESFMLPGWVGSLGIVLWVWYFDSNHQTISRWHWKHPYLTAFVFTWLWSHMVLKVPRKVLVFW